ncbi:hypothetical protein SEA_GODONK_38 [Gordonia phage GodonK]|uniref:Uncharacterized protein n=1 Tax=Gordonia phage GodonK TaxID=2562192 RepID=A0A4D6E216_9CAUD|nr:hypothetical protein HOV33_gp038 [Gordonia phage GodonK]QBZ72657.1 hypothetical protein SEA_GODONK_38 [Gordonia phage GodonK]
MIFLTDLLSTTMESPAHAVVHTYSFNRSRSLATKSRVQYRAICGACFWFATPSWRYFRAKVEAADHNNEFHGGLQNSFVRQLL